MIARQALLRFVPLAAALVGVSSRAAAEPKLELGARAGYALPLGKLETEGAMAQSSFDDFASGQVPLWLDLGVRLAERWHVGGYLQYGVIVFADDVRVYCDELERLFGAEGGGASCSFHDLRMGVSGRYHFGQSGARLDPWAGLGFGYEWLSGGVGVATSDGHADVAVTYRGFEFLNLQAGLDLRVAEGMAVGPFAAFTLAAYGTITRSCAGSLCNTSDQSERIEGEHRALHHWLFFGIRVTFLS